VQRFYFPEGRERRPASAEAVSAQIRRLFAEEKGSLGAERLRQVTTKVCGLSSFCTSSLMNRLGVQPGGRVTVEAFLQLWTQTLSRQDAVARLFEVLRPPGAGLGRDAANQAGRVAADRAFLQRRDFELLLSEVVQRHPGLDFLASTPEFQGRYVQTVIARIFYAVNRSGNERLTLSELRRSKLPATIELLDTEEDINRLNDFFSYEHFYVIYCKFWELDTDHDLLLSASDLSNYENGALLSSVIDRIMSGAPRPLRCSVEGKMSYEDFVVFFISDVDKSSDVAIDYWFKCLDLDGDGVVSLYELDCFMSEQVDRLQSLSQERVLIEDVLCQINDAIMPRVKNCFRVQDIRRSKMAAFFFNIIFNVHRYALSEQKDPLVAQQLHETPQLTDWDRYAIAEYYRLADDVEQADGQEKLRDELRIYEDEDEDALLLQQQQQQQPQQQ
jgi:serine/threonine-protein phosphatase 2A regulatory subunit B''